MARNGSGTYLLPAGNPTVPGTTITSTWANTTMSDIATALTTSIAYDGQTIPVANLPMGNFKHTNVANAAARNEYSSAGQVQDGQATYLTAVSGTDTIAASLAVPPLAAYVAGQNFRFIPAGINTTAAVTLNVNGLGARNILKGNGLPLSIGDIKPNSIVEVTYDGTQFQITADDADFTSISSINTTATLTNADLARLIVFTGASTFTTILPAASACPAGTGISFQSQCTGTVTVSRAGSDVIVMNGTTSVNSITLGTGDNLRLISSGTSWFAISGTAQLAFANYFRSNTNFDQSFPTGTLIQSGDVGSVAQGGTLVVSFPRAYTSAPTVVATVNSAGGNTTPFGLGIVSIGTTSFTVAALGAVGALTGRWMAFGK